MPPSDHDPARDGPSPDLGPSPTGRAEQLEWVSPHRADTDDLMAARGLRRVRLLDQMTRDLPVDPAERGDAEPLRVRPFRAGADDDGVLRVNNRAFDWHPDQAGWDRGRLRAALDQDWVDPTGFLVHDGADGRIDGFCWTRVHPATPERPATGEIFVIAADPDRHGTGLGKALVLAGLDHLAGLGLRTAMLYVESDNVPAIRLYERLGFAVDHRDAAYAPTGAQA